jgi:hypothetical protein
LCYHCCSMVIVHCTTHCCLMVIVHCVTTVVQWLLYIVLPLLFNGYCTLFYHCCSMVIVHCATTGVQWLSYIVLPLLFNGYCTLCYHYCSISYLLFSNLSYKLLIIQIYKIITYRLSETFISRTKLTG